ncbi:hypothetical protein BSR03_17160 [Serratia proteamaculans]|uniref:hypothetical protein n=1 Tax=Serratia proteamaculans TaxID=28151 RepID=UPI0010213E4A|nr:hypothetical protein [Serratia proteamaculans]RYM60172.1 hypothetical protein BSR03_17160 [Serratia proteamaculans]
MTNQWALPGRCLDWNQKRQLQQELKAKTRAQKLEQEHHLKTQRMQAAIPATKEAASKLRTALEAAKSGKSTERNTPPNK